ncbi:MAG: alpha/beta fold hydrolase [Rhodothermales bacterium]
MTNPDLPQEVAAAPVMLGHSTFGQGPEKVLVFHDWMGDAKNYDPLLPFLDPYSFTYVFADLRGYGQSLHLNGKYTAEESAGDAFELATHLGWHQFHIVGHSMSGMVVQRMALDDWHSANRRLKSITGITPVSANGYPADEDTKAFLWGLIQKREASEMGFSMLTGQRLLDSWSRLKTVRHLETSSKEAMEGYFNMWLAQDFSEELAGAHVETPLLVIGGRQDLPGFQQTHLESTFGQWYSNVEFCYITDAGHYPMQETPVYLATQLQKFLSKHV